MSSDEFASLYATDFSSTGFNVITDALRLSYRAMSDGFSFSGDYYAQP